MSSRMNLTNKLYQRMVLERIAETDWQTGNSAPLVVELDPTAVCDLACPGCISQDLLAIGNRFSDETLLRLGHEFIECGVKAVILIGGGEPLTHPKIASFIELVSTNDIHVGITTNGTFIGHYLELIAQHVKWTRVSMDASSEEMFSRLRPSRGGKSKFHSIIENMRKLAAVKRGTLGYSFLIQTEADGPGMPCNIHEIVPAARLAKEIGCDYFEVKPTYQFRSGIPHALMKHDPARMQEARKQISLLEELEDDRFTIMKAINLEYSLSGEVVSQPKDYKVCPSTHLRTTVTPGGVYVCPYWRGKSHMRVGDVNDTSFSAVWNGDLRREVMDRLNASQDCYFHCLRHETNVSCYDIKQLTTHHENICVVDDFDRFI